MLYIGIERNKKNIIYSLFVYFYINTLRIISNKRSSEVSSMTTNNEIIQKKSGYLYDITDGYLIVFSLIMRDFLLHYTVTFV